MHAVCVLPLDTAHSPESAGATDAVLRGLTRGRRARRMGLDAVRDDTAEGTARDPQKQKGGTTTTRNL